MAPDIKRNYRSPAQDARLLVRQAVNHRADVSNSQRICAKKGGEPCHMASCPRCRKRLATVASAAVIERYGDLTELQWLTITPAAGRVELDDAAEFNVPRFHELVRRKLREALPKGGLPPGKWSSLK